MSGHSGRQWLGIALSAPTQAKITTPYQYTLHLQYN